MESAVISVENLRKFVVEKAEKELHLSGFYPRRKQMWDSFLSGVWADTFLTDLRDIFLVLKEDYMPPARSDRRLLKKSRTGGKAKAKSSTSSSVPNRDKEEGEAAIKLRCAWPLKLREEGMDHKLHQFLQTSLPDMDLNLHDHDLCCIMATLQCHVFSACNSELTIRPSPSTTSSSGAKKDTKRTLDFKPTSDSEDGAAAETVTGVVTASGSGSGTGTGSGVVTDIPPQPDWGLHLLAGGCLGEMFRLNRKKRHIPTHKQMAKVLAAVIVSNKDMPAPVQQKCRDRGGMFYLHSDFFKFLRQLDETIRKEFVGSHGHDIVKVIMAKVKSDQQLNSMCSSLTRARTLQMSSSSHVSGDVECAIPDEVVDDFTKTFIRKYTNARIGGFIKGEADRGAEQSGKRSKGAAGLRDTLLVLTSKKSEQGGRGGKRGRKGGAASSGASGQGKSHGEQGEEHGGKRGRHGAGSSKASGQGRGGKRGRGQVSGQSCASESRQDRGRGRGRRGRGQRK